MVRAWYRDENETDPRSPHIKQPTCWVELNQLKKETGVEFFWFDVSTVDENDDYAELRRGRGYSYEDKVDISKSTMANYEEQLKLFYTEHMHEYEEIRYIEDGSGYFDVRDAQDQWIRAEVQKGDLIIMPAGIYHRFTLDHKNYVRARRLFKGSPVWTAIYRPADDHPTRVEYVKNLGSF